VILIFALIASVISEIVVNARMEYSDYFVRWVDHSVFKRDCGCGFCLGGELKLGDVKKYVKFTFQIKQKT
jgi:hypothetical protein